MLDDRVQTTIREVVDRYRAQCLWFLRADYYPHTSEEVDRVFRFIEQYGDLDALRRVAAIRVWLSRPSSATSAAS